MDKPIIDAKADNINEFKQWLISEEREVRTIEKYMRDISEFFGWLGNKAISKDEVLLYKEHLLKKAYKPATVNSILAAINTYCRFAGLNIRIKYLRVQRRTFQEENRSLRKEEYERLISEAERSGKRRLSLLIETIGATGIRVSEVKHITVEALNAGRAEISLKGKIRTILLPGKLCRKLLKYAKKQKIAFGEIFITKSGKGISRKQIWAEMKSLCKKAGVQATKVFPHNLRHLFARVYYKATHDIVKLADLLGHSSVETTRIYLISTGEEHTRQLEKLGLVH